MDDDKNLGKSTHPPMRPLVVSIASLIVFLLGFALTVSAAIAAVALGIITTYAQPPSVYIFAIVFGLFAGPILVLSGYNLWKMKRWSAKLAAIIVLFDLLSTPVIKFSLSIDIGIGDILAWTADIIILTLTALSLKHMRG
jgi:hypothetical protein